MAAKKVRPKALAPAANKLPAKAVTAAFAQAKQSDANPSADTEPMAKAAAKPSAPATITLKHPGAALTERHDLPKK